MRCLPALLLLAGCAAAGEEERYVDGGTLRPGNDAGYPEERSGPPVQVAGFWIDVHEVTNAEFAEFVERTGYRTIAERGLAGRPDLPPALRAPGGAVFVMPEAGQPGGWRFVPGASWRHPDGPGSSIEGRMDEPVVQVAYADALAYARWKDRDLPTEAEWEWAAGGDDPPAPRTRPTNGGKPSANAWDGPFPAHNAGTDGHVSRAPVGSFPADANGLHDMRGNVWEWTADAWRADHRSAGADPRGRAIKGGSYLCAQNFCARYRPEARQFAEADLGTSHIGFRTVRRVEARDGS